MKRSMPKPKKAKSKKHPITQPLVYGWGWIEHGRLRARTSGCRWSIVSDCGISDHAEDHPHADDDHYPVKVVICTAEEWDRRKAKGGAA